MPWTGRTFRCLILIMMLFILIFQDMCSDDIMILDTGNELYLWVGKEATEEEKQSSLKLAQVSIFFQRH